MSTDFRFLHEYPLFSSLTEKQMGAVMQVCREECFLPNVTLFDEGQPAEEIFVLMEGEVEEVFTAGDAKLTPTHPVGQGEIIGCPALVPPHTHRCTARSLTQIEVLNIDANGLRKLFEQDCKLAVSIQQFVIQALLERIGRLRLVGTEYA
jgi:CRP-like cAMP-binding protein